MSNIQIFRNPQFGEVRTATDANGEPLFCAKDVATVLGYSDTNDAISRHCKSGKKVFHPHTNGIGGVNMIYIPERDVFRLIMRSNLPDAEQFQDWVCEDVLPSIRKHGAYMTPETLFQAIQNPDNLIQLLTALKNQQEQNALLQMQNKANTQVIEAMKPKAEYFDTVLRSTSLIATDAIAAELGISAIKLNKFLCEMGIQRKVNGVYVLLGDLRDKGFVGYKTFPRHGQVTDEPKTVKHMYWTEKGAFFVMNLYRANNSKLIN